MLKTSGYYILYVSTFRSTETGATLIFFCFILEGKETRGTDAHAHDSCIYCTELVMKPHDDLMSTQLLLSVSLSLLKVNSAVLMSQVKKKRCKSQREKDAHISEKVIFLFNSIDSLLHTAEFTFL